MKFRASIPFPICAVFLMAVLVCSSCRTTEQQASQRTYSSPALKKQAGSASRRSTLAGSLSPKIKRRVLARSNKKNTRVVVDVSKQKAYLLVDNQIAMESPVSTARSGKHTPRGTFRITERVRNNKVSTIYNVEMPYWMRLSGSVYGLHHGYLPGYPASAGCVRFPEKAAQLIYDHTGHGTRVSIHSRWKGA